MNKKIAISLIVGVLFSAFIAFLTSENKYYRLGKTKREITSNYYNPENLRHNKETKFNTPFIIIGFLGGFGLGYLFSEKIERKLKI